MIKQFFEQTLRFFYPIFKKFMAFEVYAYLALGGLNTFINIALFIVFYQFVFPKSGIDVVLIQINSYTLSLISAFLVTVPSGYWLSRNLTFQQTAATAAIQLKQFLRYTSVVLQGLISDYILIKCMVDWLGITPVAAKIISSVLVLTLNYFLQKYFTFNIKKSSAVN